MDLHIILAIPYICGDRARACASIFVSPQLARHSIFEASNALVRPSGVCLPRLHNSFDDGVAPQTSSTSSELTLAASVELRWLPRLEGSPDLSMCVTVDGCEYGVIRCADSAASMRLRKESIQERLLSHLQICKLFSKWFHLRSPRPQPHPLDQVEPRSTSNASQLCVLLSVDNKSTSTSRAPVEDRLYQLAAELLEHCFLCRSREAVAATAIGEAEGVVAAGEVFMQGALQLTTIAGSDPVGFCAWLTLRKPLVASAVLKTVDTVQFMGGNEVSATCIRNFSSGVFNALPYLSTFSAQGSPITSIAGLPSACVHLRNLDLSKTLISDADVALIGKYSRNQVVVLALHGCSRITSIDPLSACAALTSLNVSECWMLKSFGKAVATLAHQQRLPNSATSAHALQTVCLSLLDPSVDIEWPRVLSMEKVPRSAFGGSGGDGVISSVTTLSLRAVWSAHALLPNKLCTCDRPSSERIECPLSAVPLLQTVRVLALSAIPFAPIGASTQRHRPEDLQLFLSHVSHLRSLTLQRCHLFGNAPNTMRDVVRQLVMLECIEIDGCGDALSPGMRGLLSLDWVKEPGVVWRGMPRCWLRITLKSLPLPPDVQLAHSELVTQQRQQIKSMDVRELITDWW